MVAVFWSTYFFIAVVLSFISYLVLTMVEKGKIKVKQYSFLDQLYLDKKPVSIALFGIGWPIGIIVLLFVGVCSLYEFLVNTIISDDKE